MNVKKLVARFLAYNHWANTQLNEWLMGMEDAFIHQQTRSSFASIALTLQHMQKSQLFWLGIIADSEKISVAPSLSDDLAQLLAGSQMMIDTFSAYTEEELLEEVSSTDMVQSRYEFILHVVNHNSYHRGQIVTMCRQLGITDNIPPGYGLPCQATPVSPIGLKIASGDIPYLNAYNPFLHLFW